MTINGLVQIGLYFVVLLALVKPLGWYMARVYEGQPCGLDRVVGPLERLIYRLCGVRETEEMDWKTYGIAMLLFNAMGLVALYALQRLQGFLPLNPAGLGAVTTDLAFNTAASFATNTNWQAYGGETTLSYLTQMLGLTVQNFVSAATGMAILVALIRGLARRSATDHRQLLDGPRPQHTLHSPAAGPALVPAVGVTRRRPDVRVIPDRHIAPAGQLRHARNGCERPAGAG